jgi:predicted RNA-binding protein YlqC (UPF0109 family)
VSSPESQAAEEDSRAPAFHSTFDVGRSMFDVRALARFKPCPELHLRHHAPMQVVTDQIRNFLQYIAVQFIEFPAEAQLKVTELGPKRLRFKLVLRQSDVALLIGRNGFSASAIRGVIKSISEREDVNVNLQIHSHEEEAEMQARERH